MNGMGEVYGEDQASALARLERNEILMVIQVPRGFFDISLSLQKRPPITLWLNPRMPAETAIFVRALRSYADSIAGIQAAYVSFGESIRPLYSDINDYNQELTDTFSQLAVWALARRGVITTDETARMSTPLHVIASIVCLMCMQTGLLLMAQAQDERKSGVMYRMALSQAPWWASPLARQLAGLLWAGVVLAPLLTGLKIYYPQARLESILPAVLCLFWVTAAFCQGAGYLSGGSVLALPGMWLFILAMLLLGGCIYPQTLLPDVLKPLMVLSPAYFAYQTVYAGLKGAAAPEGAQSAFLVMALISAAFLGLAWKKSLAASRMGRLL
ncbi:MAG: ABC transporter permease, partial [Eubacteriales bacterium]|nr:ABC transporter permease [Eubacteriales bacterium]